MLIANMLMFLIALAALAGTTRAGCDACIDGRCHSRNTIISGFPITDQMAVDRFANILYLQLNDNNEIRLINMMKTTGMFFDEDSRKLYLGTKEIPKTFYKYDRVSNITETKLVLNDHPDLQDYSGHNLLLMLGADEWNDSRTYLKNLTISGLVVDKYSEKVYFVSNNTLYEHYNGDQPARAILSRDHMVLSTAGVVPVNLFRSQIEVYIGDASEKVIYKLDERTEELKVYAAYKKGAVEDFIFGKNHQLLTRDVDGSVVEWIPITETDRGNEDLPIRGIFPIIETRCVIDPPSPSYSIRQLEPVYCK